MIDIDNTLLEILEGHGFFAKYPYACYHYDKNCQEEQSRKLRRKISATKG